MRYGYTILLSVIVWLVVTCPAWCVSKELSADMVMMEGKEVVETMKLSVSGQNVRMESSITGESTVTIMRRDRKLIWMLYPARKQYSEQPLDTRDQSKDPSSDPPGVIKKVQIGTEQVGGYRCTKYRMTIKGPGGGTLAATSWFADALGMPIKSDFSGIITELRNIRVGSQPAALFEIPAGWKKISATVPKGVKMPANIPPEIRKKMQQHLDQNGQ